MNIQKAIVESQKQNKIMSRRKYEGHLRFIPTDDVFKMVMIVDLSRKRPPGKRWQPFAEDLIAD